VFVTTFDAASKELATVAIDRASGQVRWSQVVPTKNFEQVHATGSLATPTPASNGSHIFVFFGSYGLLCYDWDGNVVWERPMGPFQDEFGAASSPVLVDGKVILNEDHDIDSFLIAIDQKTGETVWKVAREEATRSYSTPVLLERDGHLQVLVAGSLRLTSYDVQTGEQLWWYDGLSRIVDSTPVVNDGVIYLATWTPGGDSGERISMEPFVEALRQFDKNDDGVISRDELPADSPVLERFFRIDLNQDQSLDQTEWTKQAEIFARAQNVALALAPGDRGPLANQYVLWTYQRGLPTVPSSVVYDGTMTMVKDSGIITVLDASNGALIKQLRAEGRGNYYASLVAGDGKVYLTSEGGVISVLRSGKDPEVIASYDFQERIMATPVIAENQFFVRTEEALYCYTAITDSEQE
jgi:outer membrane protein assembly factor BamB